jgi:hypothetical protein
VAIKNLKLKTKTTYACHVIKNEDSMSSWQLRGVIERIFTLREGINNIFFTRGKEKLAYFAGGKTYLP